MKKKKITVDTDKKLW